MNTDADCAAAASAAVRCREWERLKREDHLSGNQAAAVLGRSPAWFAFHFPRWQREGIAAFLPERRHLGAARTLFPVLPSWFMAVARFYFLNTNLTRTRGSVPEAIRCTIRLPACPLAVQRRLIKVCLNHGWTPLNGEKLPSCPVELRESILARAKALKPMLPPSITRNIAIAAPFVRHHRNPKDAALDYISAAGTQMWITSAESGERQFIQSGVVVECDDATINFPVCVGWQIRGCPCSERWGVKVGRFQWLVAIDVGSRKILGFTYTARPRSSYRSEDVLSLMRCVVKQHGIPRTWRLEKGVWKSNLVVDAVKAMGSGRISVHSPHAKPFIEGLFNTLWTKLSSHFPDSSVGRFRGEGQEASRLLTASQNGSQDPRRHFPMLADVIAAFEQVIAEHNAHTVDSPQYGRWIPNERWAADMLARPLPRLAPETDWLFSPFVRTWTVRGNSVSGRVPLFENLSVPYVFQAPFLLEFHGATVRCHFDPSEPRCAATVVLAQAFGNHRAGAVLGIAWQVNETTSYIRWVMGYGSDDRTLGLQAISQSASALRRVVRGIAGPSSGDAFEPQFSEDEARDGLGRLSKITRETESPPAVIEPPLPPSPPVIFTTRTGKIARLPMAIRQALNTRLRDGAVGRDLVTWLNGVADVHEVLQREFQSTKITKQNLSEWRKGGYTDWLQAEEKILSKTDRTDRSPRTTP